jgi:hypothetical protein
MRPTDIDHIPPPFALYFTEIIVAQHLMFVKRVDLKELYHLKIHSERDSPPNGGGHLAGIRRE